MRRTLLVGVVSLTFAISAVQAQMAQSLSLSGPTTWTPGASVVLAMYMPLIELLHRLSL